MLPLKTIAAEVLKDFTTVTRDCSGELAMRLENLASYNGRLEKILRGPDGERHARAYFSHWVSAAQLADGVAVDVLPLTFDKTPRP